MNINHQNTLFKHPFSEPLASRIRPKDLYSFVGQDHRLGKGEILRHLIETDKVPSMIF